MIKITKDTNKLCHYNRFLNKSIFVRNYHNSKSNYFCTNNESNQKNEGYQEDQKKRESTQQKTVNSFLSLMGSNKVKVSNTWRGLRFFWGLKEDALKGIGGEYENILNSIEDKTQDIMDVYYNIIGHVPSKHLGTFFFYSTFTNQNDPSVWNIIEAYLDIDLAKDFVPKRSIVIHCKRNKEDVTFFEKLNIDGSRNFIKKNINEFDSVIRKENANAASTVLEFIYSSKNVDNLTLVIIPEIQNIDPFGGEKAEREVYSLFRIYKGYKYLFPLFKRSSRREAIITESLDKLGLYTNPILTFSEDDPKYRELIIGSLPPRSDKTLFYENKSTFKKMLKDRIYKVFLKNNENHLKSVITEKFLESHSIFKYSCKKPTKFDFSKKYFLIWSKESIALKLVLTKFLQNKLNEFFHNEIDNENHDIYVQISGKSVKDTMLSTDKLEPFKHNFDTEVDNIAAYSSCFEKVLDPSIDTDKSKLILQFKDEWLFTSQSLRSPVFIESFKKDYLTMFTNSLDQINEVEGISFEKEHFKFYELWNILFKRILSKLLISDLSSSIPYILLDEMVKAVGKQEEETNIRFLLSVHSEEFKKNLSSEFVDTIISKEFYPSVSFEEFRETLMEEFDTLDSNKTIKIKGFSKLWNYIYFKAVSKKLSSQIVNASFSNIISPFFLNILESYYGKQFVPIELYDKKLETLTKNSLYIKQNLGFKSKKEINDEQNKN
ncbi:hypothetical protein DICPUDRAFT_149390 [Dictyostelium purpureum]|uniref:Uncharacterized protein n=1 Tax=Dictyostelium purpureum TaxID=5786 RepID=F0ZDK8_DICPU|nr:uncharacterized protein DICPUDRAFT_149390 [Dictyostelium purpureum]EGC37931.1 hypothetical protein DICPUDRAFT_149390 [Dictyostelium purpureum]|eukprot:XP_003285502.1 hypothetical protein DICPUDRAFT_149390 [Dictyostelium purpureum]